MVFENTKIMNTLITFIFCRSAKILESSFGVSLYLRYSNNYSNCNAAVSKNEVQECVYAVKVIFINFPPAIDLNLFAGYDIVFIENYLWTNSLAVLLIG